MVRGIPCMGPVTQAGCDALCPVYERGCFGCFGPMESPNTLSLEAWWRRLGATDSELINAFRSYNASAPAFRKASDSIAARAAGAPYG